MVNSRSKTIIFNLIGLVLFVTIALFTHGYSLFCDGIVLILGTAVIYYSLRALFKDPFDCIFCLITLFLILNFSQKIYYQSILFIIFAVLLFIFLKNKKNIMDMLFSDWHNYNTSPLIDRFAWLIIVLVICVLGIKGVGGFFVYDTIHPITEVSFGRSFGLGFLNPPDLSYSGSYARYYFLGTRSGIFLSELLGIPLLESVYFVTPLFFVFITIILVSLFFSRFPVVRTPIFLLFFLPLMCPSLTHYEGLARNMFFLTNAYSLAFILMILAIYYLVSRKYIMLMIVTIMLLLTKVSFCFTLSLGIVLFLARNREYKLIFIFSAILIMLFITLYFLFMSGTADQNLWVLFPTTIYSKAPGILVSQTVIFSKSRWAAFIIELTFYLSVLYIYLRNKTNDILLGLSSVSLAGIIYIFLILEITALNSWYFFIATFFSTPVIFFYVFNLFLQNKNSLFRKTAVFALNAFVIFSMFFSPLKTEIWNNLRNYLTYDLSTRNATLNVFFQKIGFKSITIPKPFTRDVIDAYTWLGQKITTQEVVLYGKHYERICGSLIRSAISGRQIYCEGGKAKAIVMKNDFTRRYANSINFYSQLVLPGKFSKEALDYYYEGDFGKIAGKPLLEYIKPAYKAKLLYYLSFGKQWSWLNLAPQFHYEVRQYLSELASLNPEQQKKWAVDFLMGAHIKYIVLENEDKPTDFLVRMTEEIYKKNSVIILKVKDMVL